MNTIFSVFEIFSIVIISVTYLQAILARKFKQEGDTSKPYSIFSIFIFNELYSFA